MVEFGGTQDDVHKEGLALDKPTIEVKPEQDTDNWKQVEPMTEKPKIKVDSVPIPSPQITPNPKGGENLENSTSSFEGLPVMKFRLPRIIQPPGLHLGGKLYLRDSLLEDCRSGEPKPETMAMLTHEYTHFQRMGAGIKDQVIKFWTRPRFRFQEELAATREEMKVLRQHDRPFDIDKRAKDWSGFSYGWCTKYSTARQELEKMWDEIGDETRS